MSANETFVNTARRPLQLCLNEFEKRGGRSVELKKAFIQEIDKLGERKNANLQGLTWSNPSMKIHCRLDYFMISKDVRTSLKYVKKELCFEEKEAKRGPGF